VAKSFAAEGAHVALAGRSVERLDAVLVEIVREGGRGEVAAVDAHDEQAVGDHLQRLLAATGRLDVSFNAVGLSYVFGKPLTEATVEGFSTTVQAAMRTHFVTATAAGRQMAQAGSGTILTITATPARMPLPNQGSLGVVGAAVEGLCRQLAVDLGPRGVRVICLRSAGSPDAPDVSEAMNVSAERAGISREAFEEQLTAGTALRRLPRLAEVGAAAALAASDHASAITGTVLNVTCGEIMD
jgi:NAD(P)-dependent dehydrogenase (short-subunit alcohol dehydrogenase family)